MPFLLDGNVDAKRRVELPMTSQTDTEIDFLPADFHLRRTRRNARRFRGTVSVSFLVLIAVGLLGNRLQFSRLTAQRDELQLRVLASQERVKELNELRSEIIKLQHHADLHGYLQLQPAATSLLAVVTSSLPENMALKSLQLRIAASHGTKEGAKTPVTPHQADLERLAYETEEHRRVVSLEGIAPDDEAIADYLVAMRETGAFDKVQLLYTDHLHHWGHDLRTFSAEMRLRRLDTDGPQAGSSIAITSVGEGVVR